jgi:hypothetical protein
VTVGVHAKHAAILGPARRKRELAREAAGATGERAEERVGDAMRRHAHGVFVDGELLLVNGVFADVQKVRDAEDLDVLFALGARGDFDDGFGAELFPRVDVDGILERVHAGRRVGVLDDVEHAGELDVVTNDGAHHHVFDVRRERRQNRDARELVGLVTRDDELAELGLVRFRSRRSGRNGRRRRGSLSERRRFGDESREENQEREKLRHGHCPENRRGITLPRMSG